MKHCKQPSCITRVRNRCKGDQCGTNIDLDDVDFTRQQPNLVYMDKIFSLNDTDSCPLLYSLDTTGSNHSKFTYTLTTSPRHSCDSDCDCNSSCNCNSCQICCCCCGSNTSCTIDSSAVFKVKNTKVIVEAFYVATGSSISPSQVTVDGYPVDSITQTGDEYIATTDNLIGNISKKRCMEEGLPTKAFLLLSNIGSWAMKLKIILEGTVNSNGQTCDFCAEIATAPTVAITLPSSSSSSFAIPDLSLPCSVRGMSPTIRFQFDACIAAQNASLTYGHRYGDADDRDDSDNRRNSLNLKTSLVIDPTVEVEVVRQSIFNINAREMIACCDELAPEDDDDCDGDYECECNRGCACESDRGCGCNRDEDDDRRCGCGARRDRGGFEQTSPSSFRGIGGCDDDDDDCRCNCGEHNHSCGCQQNRDCGCENRCEHHHDDDCRCENVRNNNSSNCLQRRRSIECPPAIQFYGCGCGQF